MLPLKLKSAVFFSFVLVDTANQVPRRMNGTPRLAALQRSTNSVSSSILCQYLSFPSFIL